MIKWSHLTPKSKHRWLCRRPILDEVLLCSFLCSCICLMLICFPFQKKRHLDFFLFLFCSAFPTSNSLQIFQLIPCKSLWDLTCLSELRWQVFSLWWTRSHRFLVLGPTEFFRCNRSIPLGATDFTTGKTFCHLFLHYFWSSSTQWILSSTSITFTLVLCAVTQGPNPFTTNSRRPFLEIDVKGGERYHIKA